MVSVIAHIKSISPAIARFTVAILLVWFAAPEAQSYTPNFNPKLQSKHLQEILLQLEVIKHEVREAPGKQITTVVDFTDSFAASIQSARPVEVGAETSVFLVNAFYVNPTINAP